MGQSRPTRASPKGRGIRHKVPVAPVEVDNRPSGLVAYERRVGERLLQRHSLSSTQWQAIAPMPDVIEAQLRTIRLWLIIVAFLPVSIGMPIMLLSHGQIYEWPFTAWCVAIVQLALPDVAQRITRGLFPAGRIGFLKALRRVLEAMPRLWRGYMWYLIISAPVVFLGSAMYLAAGKWVPGYFFALAGIAFSVCMMAGGIYGLRWRSGS
jgi:hypothetical protein